MLAFGKYINLLKSEVLRVNSLTTPLNLKIVSKCNQFRNINEENCLDLNADTPSEETFVLSLILHSECEQAKKSISV